MFHISFFLNENNEDLDFEVISASGILKSCRLSISIDQYERSEFFNVVWIKMFDHYRIRIDCLQEMVYCIIYLNT